MKVSETYQSKLNTLANQCVVQGVVVDKDDALKIAFNALNKVYKETMAARNVTMEGQLSLFEAVS